MSDFYTLTTAGTPPVTRDDMKAYLKLPAGDHPDDELVTLLLKLSTEGAEAYSGRDLRVNIWTLLTDAFVTRICLNRDPVVSVTSINYLVSGSPVTVADSVYYLKKSTQFSEILLVDGQAWPTDLDTVEAGITTIFVTAAHARASEAKGAIQKHVAYLYANRGDCEPASDTDALKRSGAASMLDSMSIARV